MKSLFDAKKSVAWVGTGVFVLVIVLIGIRVAAGQSPGDFLGNSFAIGAGDDEPVGRVGGLVITRGQFAGLKAALVHVEKLPEDLAGQEAMNRLVRQKIIQAIAKERGLTPDAQEVEGRLDLLFEQAAQNPEVQAVLEPQARARGLEWDSEAFKDTLRESMTRALEAEHLYQQVYDQMGGDAAKAWLAVEVLISDNYPLMDVRLETSNLPEETGDIHLPSAEELRSSQPKEDAAP